MPSVLIMWLVAGNTVRLSGAVVEMVKGKDYKVRVAAKKFLH